MGLNEEIEPRGLFPGTNDAPVMTLGELESVDRWTHDHPSFALSFGGGGAPLGTLLVAEYVDVGFGKLFVDSDETEKAHLHRSESIPFLGHFQREGG